MQIVSVERRIITLKKTLNNAARKHKTMSQQAS